MELYEYALRWIALGLLSGVVLVWSMTELYRLDRYIGNPVDEPLTRAEQVAGVVVSMILMPLAMIVVAILLLGVLALRGEKKMLIKKGDLPPTRRK